MMDEGWGSGWGSATDGWQWFIAMLSIALIFTVLFTERPYDYDKHRMDFKKYFLELVTVRILGALIIFGIGYGLLSLIDWGERTNFF
jgi:hypothetical protein